MNNMYGNPYFAQQTRFQPMVNQPMPTQNYVQPITQPTQPVGLLGKIVDGIETAKTAEYPLDGSVSYFALADGSAIVTKQLQTDGTSKIVVFKPAENENDKVRYITSDDLEKSLEKFNLSDLEEFRDDLDTIKKELKDIQKKLKSKGE